MTLRNVISCAKGGNGMTIFGITVSMAVVWLALAVIFLIIEGITVGLATIWGILVERTWENDPLSGCDGKHAFPV